MKGFKEEIGQLMALSHDNEKCYRHLYIHTTKEDLKIDKNKKIMRNQDEYDLILETIQPAYILLNCGTEIHNIIIESERGLLDLSVANAIVGI